MTTRIIRSARGCRATSPGRWRLRALLAVLLLAVGGHGLTHLLEHDHQHAGVHHHGHALEHVSDHVHGPDGHVHDGTHLVDHHHGDGDAAEFDLLLVTRARATPSTGGPMPAPIPRASRIVGEERAAPREARAPPGDRLHLIETVVLTI